MQKLVSEATRWFVEGKQNPVSSLLGGLIYLQCCRLKVTVQSFLSLTVRFEQRVSKSMIISNLVTFLRTCVLLVFDTNLIPSGNNM